MGVPVFISYHGKDIALASELNTSLGKLSEDFEIFFDKESIRASEDYEIRIAEAIRTAEWFLIICTGFPRRDADMMWSFFEAGQFRATLKQSLVSHANKRIACLFDSEPPSILSKFQGVKVCGLQPIGPKSEMLSKLGKDNPQLEETPIYKLLEQMLENVPDQALRDVTAKSTKLLLREESHKLIELFEAAGSTNVIFERSLQPRISFELAPATELAGSTPVKGYDQSLRNLFGIETEETTWARLVGKCCKTNGAKPAWLTDVELAANKIMRDEAPDYLTNKCVLGDKIYRVHPARYEIFKNGHRAIYVVFLPTSSRPFDLTKRSSTLLSSLILSIRFREQIIPLATSLAHTPPEALGEALQAFYRLLVSIEIEARQFGLVVDSPIPGEETPLAAVFTDNKKKKFIRESIGTWTADRELIEKIFVDDPVDLSSPAVAEKCSQQIIAMLDNIRDINSRFIELIAEEQLLQLKHSDSSHRKSKRRKKSTPAKTSRKVKARRRGNS